MTSTTRRVLVRSLDDITVEQAPAPEPDDGEALVETTLVGICGSDTHAAMGEHPRIDLPYWPGHEVVGVVTAVGAGVDGVRPGDRVAVEPSIVCGTCPQCRSGRANICRRLRVFGCQFPGGMTDRFVLPADRLHRLPAGLSDLAAALVEPLATPVHAVGHVGDLQGRGVVVLGAGPIGLLTMAAARHAGAAAVVVTDLAVSKRDRALALGAAAAVDAARDDVAVACRDALGDAPAVVFDCVARSSSMAQAVDAVDRGGTVVVVGVPPGGGVRVPLDTVQDSELRVQGTLMYTSDDVRRAIDMLAAGAVAADAVVTATFPLDRAGDAFRAAVDPDQVKVLVRVAG